MGRAGLAFRLDFKRFGKNSSRNMVKLVLIMAFLMCNEEVCAASSVSFSNVICIGTMFGFVNFLKM
jgi:hypothetical protein